MTPDHATLHEIHKEYKKLLEWGYNRLDSGERCTRAIPSPPHIYVDDLGYPTHCFKGDYVLLFDDGIYKKVQ